MKKYHKKTDYVRLYKFWCKELGEPCREDADMLPTPTLIDLIDKLLIKYDCLPFDTEEKEYLIKNMNENE